MNDALFKKAPRRSKRPHLHKPPRVGHEVVGVLVVDGGQLPLGGALGKERVNEETAEDVQGAVEVPRVHVEVIVRILTYVPQ